MAIKSALFRISVSVILAVVLLTGAVKPAMAIDQASLNSILNHTPFYGPTEPVCTNGSTTTSSGLPTAAGGTVYVIGDSYSNGLQSAGLKATLLKNGYNKVVINANDGRSVTSAGGGTSNPVSGLKALDNDKAVIQTATAVLIVLGTNGLSSSDVDQFMTKLNSYNGNARKFWLNTGNTFQTSADIKNTNDIIAAGASKYKYTVVDWFSAFSKDPNGTTNRDSSSQRGLHPSAAGYKVLLKLITDALLNAASQQGSSTAPASSGIAAGIGVAAQKAKLPKSVAEITKTTSTDTNNVNMNAKITYQYLIGVGLKPPQVGAIMGNLTGEAHFRADDGSEHFYTTGWPTGGYGIAQWTGYTPPDNSSNPHRRYYMVEAMKSAGIGDLYNQAWGESPRGKTPADKAGLLLGFNLDYLWYDINAHYSSMLADMNKTNDVDQATTYFYDVFEAPGSGDTSLPGRKEAAKKWIAKFSGLTGLDGSAAASGCDPTAAPAPSTASGGVVTTNFGPFVFPLQTTQTILKKHSPAWCWQDTKQTCHGTEGFGYYASDIFNPPGTTVVAAVNGVIKNVGQSNFGMSITLKGNDCANGTFTCKGQGTLFYYTHMAAGSAVVKVGDSVTAGQVMAKSGTNKDTGNDSPSHLHFEAEDRHNEFRPYICQRSDPSPAHCAEVNLYNIQSQLHDAFLKLPQ